MKFFFFFSNKQTEKKTVRSAYHATAEEVLEVWKKAHIPARLHKHAIGKVDGLFREWEKLCKNKENKVKWSVG